MTLQAGQWMLLDPRQMLPVIGLPGESSAVINLFIVMVLLWYTVKIPGLVGRFVSQGGGRPSILGMIVRVVFVQRAVTAVT